MALRATPIPSTSAPHLCFQSLPTEIRVNILEYVFEENREDLGFLNSNVPGGIVINDDYTANSKLQPLFTCRQMYHDGSLIALNRTSFVVTNLFFNIPDRLALLHPKQIEAVRNITFLADARHFRKLRNEWNHHPFGMPNLRLDTVTIVLHRSSHWHYMNDFTRDITMLLRVLQGVGRLIFVKNSALVKGSFKTWYNRLVREMLAVDQFERFHKTPSNPEQTWWTWSFDENAQSFCMEACGAKPIMSKDEYIVWREPLDKALKISIESEEYNPDPRSRNGF